MGVFQHGVANLRIGRLRGTAGAVHRRRSVLHGTALLAAALFAGNVFAAAPEANGQTPRRQGRAGRGLRRARSGHPGRGERRHPVLRRLGQQGSDCRHDAARGGRGQARGGLFDVFARVRCGGRRRGTFLNSYTRVTSSAPSQSATRAARHLPKAYCLSWCVHRHDEMNVEFGGAAVLSAMARVASCAVRARRASHDATSAPQRRFVIHIQGARS